VKFQEVTIRFGMFRQKSTGFDIYLLSLSLSLLDHGKIVAV